MNMIAVSSGTRLVCVKRADIEAIARKMTYLELAADNAFTDQFMAVLFLPHTDETQFPSVAKAIEKVG